MTEAATGQAALQQLNDLELTGELGERHGGSYNSGLRRLTGEKPFGYSIGRETSIVVPRVGAD
jgi:hypothetical protein